MNRITWMLNVWEFYQTCSGIDRSCPGYFGTDYCQDIFHTPCKQSSAREVDSGSATEDNSTRPYGYKYLRPTIPKKRHSVNRNQSNSNRILERWSLLLAQLVASPFTTITFSKKLIDIATTFGTVWWSMPKKKSFPYIHSQSSRNLWKRSWSNATRRSQLDFPWSRPYVRDWWSWRRCKIPAPEFCILAFEDEIHSTADELLEVNLGSEGDYRPTFLSKKLDEQQAAAMRNLLYEFQDCFAWSYDEMPGLDPDVAVHHLHIKKDARPVAQPPRRIKEDHIPQMEE